jgi:hypothetical protein
MTSDGITHRVVAPPRGRGRAWPGHPRLSQPYEGKSWVAGLRRP